MKRTYLTLLSAPCLALCLVGFRLQAAPDLTSPKAAVRSFVDALTKRDVKSMAACIQGAQATPDLEKIFDGATQFPEFEIKDLIAETENDRSRVAAEVTMKLPAPQTPDAPRVSVTIVEMFTLQKQGDAWHLLPDDSIAQSLTQSAGASRSGQADIRPLATLVYMISSPKIAMEARSSAMATSCISNEKQIAVGILMYVQDYDEIFPRKKASYVDLVMPYIKNRQVFTCPLDARGTISYTFNANIQGVSDASIAAPAMTVLLYEGKNMQLDYRHDGRAAVAFVDGHVKMIGPEAAKSLFWYPEGKEPARVKPGKQPGKQVKKPVRKTGKHK
jgi:prepilin-type processing-associated H-X9-DG protein